MAIIDRQRAEALIRDQLVNTIFQDLPEQSTFLKMGRKLPNMTSKQTRIPVLDMLPLAYWVNGDTGLKGVTQQEWENVFIVAGELATIVPIPEAVLDDASFDIIGEVTPRVIEAMGKKIDAAVFFGNDRPAEWQSDIVTLARQAGNNVSAPSAGTDLYDSLLGESGVFGKIEEYGYMANGIISSTAMRSKLRGLRTGDGLPLFQHGMQEQASYTLDGVPMTFPLNGSFDSSVAQLIAGDFSKAVYAIRQDITVKILDQGVITDANGSIVYNLAQQDMIAMRVVMRMGWALPNAASQLNPDRLACPFAYLEPATPVTTYTYTVTVQDSSSSAVEGAIVDVNGAKLKTNGSGVAVFNLRNATYPVSVKASGFKKATTSVTINSANATATVTLAGA